MGDEADSTRLVAGIVTLLPRERCQNALCFIACLRKCIKEASLPAGCAKLCRIDPIAPLFFATFGVAPVI
jgi:hypothetical protein